MRSRRTVLTLGLVAFLLVACSDGGDAGTPGASPTDLASSGPAPSPVATTARVSAGGYHSCALDASGVASCWGLGEYGQLGTGGTDSSDAPVAVAMPEGVPFPAVAAGNAPACAIATDGSVWCWGVDGDGIHDAQGNDAHGPRRVRFPVEVRAATIDGYYHDCIATDDGAAWCWGRDTEGQLGNGSTTDSVAPVRVRAPDGVTFARVATGGFHSCALATDGTAWCWGQDLHGQLGDGDDGGDRATPGMVAMPAGATFVALSAGFNHTCGLTADGAAWCWGEGLSGQLGDGGAVDATSPVSVTMPGGVRFVSLDAGNAHTCALATDGGVWCWGLGAQGGGTATAPALVPSAVAVGDGTAATAISAGGFHTCVLTTDGAAWCWGDDGSGQLGDGTDDATPGPVMVAGWTV
ncbi:MAG: RCC1 domain-containing protein [Actinomycetota bacterium]